MADVVSFGDQIEIWQGASERDGWEIVDTFAYNVPSAFDVLDALENDIPLGGIDANIGTSATIGTGPNGAHGAFYVNLNTSQVRLEVGYSTAALGGSASFDGRIVDGKFILDDFEGFAGIQLILGDQREFLGLTAGNSNTYQHGLFLNGEGDLSFGLRDTASVGLVTGSVEFVHDAQFEITHFDNLSAEEITELLHRDPSVWDWAVESALNGTLPLSLTLPVFAHVLLRSGNECFPAGTPIRLWDGTDKPIEDITTTDTVLSFNTDGVPVPGRVDKLFTNTTQDFIRISFEDRDDLITTPGHEFLTEIGDYMQTGHMMQWRPGMSDAVKEKPEAGELLALEDWRSGENIVVMDVVSPFNAAEVFREKFLEGAKSV